MTAPTITPPPEAPSRTNAPSVFISRANAFIAWFSTFIADLADWLDYVGAVAVATATGSFQGAYAGGTTYETGQTASSGGVLYVSLVDGNIGNDPATSPDEWADLLSSRLSSHRPVFTGGSSGPAEVALVGGVIDCALGHAFTETMAGSKTLSFLNMPAGAYYGTLKLTNGGTGTLTLPAGAKTEGGDPLVLTAAGVDELGFWTTNGGTSTTWKKIATAVATA
jgi:hypothetical protein